MEEPHITVAKDYLEKYSEFSESACIESDPTSYKHLSWMLHEIIKGKMSNTKANRWLGYIQGVMTLTGILNVREERKRTRFIFNGK